MKKLKTLAQSKFCLIYFLFCSLNSFSQDTLFFLKSKQVVYVTSYTMSKVRYYDYPDRVIFSTTSTDSLIKIVFSTNKEFIYKNSIKDDIKEVPMSNNSSQLNSTTIKSIPSNADFKPNSDSKDKILLKNGEEINAKIISVSESEITYKKADFLDGPTYSILPANVFMISYSNGNKDLFNQQSVTKNTELNTQLTDGEMASKARSDAQENYTGTGSFFAGFSSILLSPLFALIPASIVSSNEPDESKLNCPNQELYDKNLQYQNSYRREAHKIKKKNVWAGYGVGAIFNTIAAFVIIYNQ